MADTPEWANQLIQKMDALTTTVTAEVARLDGVAASFSSEVVRLDGRLDHINSRFETGDASFQTLLSEFNVLKSGSAASPSGPTAPPSLATSLGWTHADKYDHLVGGDRDAEALRNSALVALCGSTPRRRPPTARPTPSSLGPEARLRGPSK